MSKRQLNPSENRFFRPKVQRGGQETILRAFGKFKKTAKQMFSYKKVTHANKVSAFGRKYRKKPFEWKVSTGTVPFSF